MSEQEYQKLMDTPVSTVVAGTHSFDIQVGKIHCKFYPKQKRIVFIDFLLSMTTGELNNLQSIIKGLHEIVPRETLEAKNEV